MEVKASVKYTRIGTQKARQVADVIRGRNLNEALNFLTFSKKKASMIIKRLLKSAAANAEQKQHIDLDNLYISSIIVNQAPHLKRFRPAARGSAAPFKKKQSHIDLILKEKK